MTTTKLFGKSIKRKEDPALIAGTGRYVEDIRLPGELSAAFVRSPYARAMVNSIDGSAALEMPVFTPCTPSRTSAISARCWRRFRWGP